MYRYTFLYILMCNCKSYSKDKHEAHKSPCVKRDKFKKMPLQMQSTSTVLQIRNVLTFMIIFQVVVHMFEFPIVMDVITENSGHNEMQISMENMDIMMSGCTCMCVSPDDTLVAACATDGSIRVISMDNRYLHRMQKRSSAISATFSPDSRHLLTGGFRSIYMWNMGSGQLECKMTRHQDFVTSLTFAVDGHCLISTSLDMMIVVWDTATRLSLCTVRAHCQLHSVGLTPDLSYLVYMPERVASLAVLKPNMALKKCLLHGENKEVSRTLEQAQAFALAFSSQPIQTTTSSGCIAS